MWAAVAARALTRWRVGDNSKEKSRTWRRMDGQMLKFLPLVYRSSFDELGGVVMDQRWGCWW